MAREEEQKRKFEQENNVVIEGDWNQIVYPSDHLKGAETGYDGNENNQPTDKQLREIDFIQKNCSVFYEFKGTSTKDAWEYIQAHYDEAKFYEKK